MWLANNFFLTALKGAFFFILFLFIFSSSCWASVVINEILPNPSGENVEWVELYNNGSESVDLTGWYLEDEASHKKIIESLGQIGGNEIKVFEGTSDGWLLNNSSETVYLKDNNDGPIDSYSYSSDPGEDKSFARIPDGGSWYTATPTKGASNGTVSPSPTPSPSPSPSPSSSSSTTSQATYKIAEVKDKNGTVLSSVKIYIDDNYTSHYAPETFTFCDGCSDGGFSQHTIKLEKSGYEDWSETKEITAGSLYEINPVMISSTTDDSSSSLSPSPSVSTVIIISPSLKPLASRKPSPSPSASTLPSPSISSSPSATVSASPQVLGTETGFNQKLLIPLGFMGAGTVLLSVAFGPNLVKKIKGKWYTFKQ